MSTSNTWAKYLRPMIGEIVMAFAGVSVISGIFLVPAFGQENNRRQGYQDSNRQQRQGSQERGGQQRQWQDTRGRRGYQPYRDPAPIYIPPPVVYDPYPSPGINLFFPFHFR